jgi:hypothetical protein
VAQPWEQQRKLKGGWAKVERKLKGGWAKVERKLWLV